ncbi:CHASE3 domain-containing protein [Fluviicola sp.]|uniref:CHASE3 domain-containing protein n=1 Tax=Fluviicola sp. TaxID=1917219 RepID=UPI0031D84042
MSGKLKIVLTFALSILVLVIVGAYAYQSTKQYKNSSEWVNHTQEVINEAQSILLNVEDIETAQRGYVITADEKFLIPYKDGVAELPKAHLKLNQLVHDNPPQRELLAKINSLIIQKTTFAEQVISVRSKVGFSAAQDLIESGEGESLMASIRSLLERFIANEESYLTTRFSDSNEQFAHTATIILASISLAILFVAITLYFFLKDYNRRLRSEKQLKASEARIKKFLESLPLGVYVVDADGVPFFTNSEAVRILGEGIISGNNYSNVREFYKSYIIGTNEPYPVEKRPVVRVLNGESNICVEDVETDKDGVRIPLRINATHIADEEGNIEFAIAVFEDITSVKEAENELRKAKKQAEESSELKEMFLANMSHEIRTPMNAVIGFTDLLLKRNLNEEEMGYVRIIKTSGENLLRIINDVLDISKIESGLMTFEIHPIAINGLFSSIKVMFAQKAREKNLQLTFTDDPNIPASILGDPTRLTQIIMNLVGNAIKFTQEGSVEVSAKLIGREEEHIQIEFSVKDTGIGIPAEKLDTIFERFTQAEKHTTRKFGGTGLGLNIVKQLVELQGGTITVNSREGAGSEFKFLLSFSTTAEIASVKPQKYEECDIERLRELKILLVEDSPINVKFISALFDNHDLKVDHAENGKVAIKKMAEISYDIILMDIEMPEMNGYETTTYIRNELKSSVPIIAMTAHTMAGESEKCLQMGMNGYLSKPIREDLLFRTLIHIGLENPKPVSEAPANLVDLSSLEKTMRGNKKVILETLEIFLHHLPENLEGIEQGVKENNFAMIRRNAHTMKSSVSILGINKIQTLLEEMERLATSESDMERIIELENSLVLLSGHAVKEIEQLKEKFKES